jgi:ATP-dependent Clp protease ATP-binding subunit ClpA
MKAQLSEEILLEPEKGAAEVAEFEEQLLGQIVGQDDAVHQLVGIYQTYLAGLSAPGRPIANLLFLGPTGCGKTRLVEAAAEILFRRPKAFIKIDCGEFQHSHDIAKLIGSPPGYIGHRETTPLITQEALDRFHTDTLKMGFLLFDEIEKANEALWQLLLGILDKATLTLGDGTRVDLSRTVIVMTSNLGAKEINEVVSGGMGFTPRAEQKNSAELDDKINRTALEAARRRFSPEFMNRIDRVVVFGTLRREHLLEILDIELNQLHQRILQSGHPFVFHCTAEAKDFLLGEGLESRYGARHLKRAIERHLVSPLSNLIASRQIQSGDIVKVHFTFGGNQLIFSKQRCSPAAVASPLARPLLASVAGCSRN